MHNHVDVGGYKCSFETFFFQNDSMPLFDVSDSDWCQKMPQYQLLLSYLLKCVGGNQSCACALRRVRRVELAMMQPGNRPPNKLVIILMQIWFHDFSIISPANGRNNELNNLVDDDLSPNFSEQTQNMTTDNHNLKCD